MAVTKTVLKLTERDAVVKVAGGAGTATIGLQTDLLKSNEELSGTIHVGINGVQWTGTTDGLIVIKRNNVVIMTLNCGASGSLEMTGQTMIPDDVQSDKDIVIESTGTATEVWVRLKKTSGYASAVETSEFGQYDDPEVVGE